jgi:hypothetical protein
VTDVFDPLDYRVIVDSVLNALLRTPQGPMPPRERFDGAGVYAIYYRGKFPGYRPISGTEVPIYVGKAIPAGARQGGSDAMEQIEPEAGTVLYRRLREHGDSIGTTETLDIADFRCRFLVVTPIWISTAESLLIRRFLPLWNVCVDGFGNHHQGKGRVGQKRSDWDTLHPGRGWAQAMKQSKHTTDEINARIAAHFRAAAS